MPDYDLRFWIDYLHNAAAIPPGHEHYERARAAVRQAIQQISQLGRDVSRAEREIIRPSASETALAAGASEIGSQLGGAASDALTALAMGNPMVQLLRPALEGGGRLLAERAGGASAADMDAGLAAHPTVAAATEAAVATAPAALAAAAAGPAAIRGLRAAGGTTWLDQLRAIPRIIDRIGKMTEQERLGVSQFGGPTVRAVPTGEPIPVRPPLPEPPPPFTVEQFGGPTVIAQPTGEVPPVRPPLPPSPEPLGAEQFGGPTVRSGHVPHSKAVLEELRAARRLDREIKDLAHQVSQPVGVPTLQPAPEYGAQAMTAVGGPTPPKPTAPTVAEMQAAARPVPAAQPQGRGTLLPYYPRSGSAVSPEPPGVPSRMDISRRQIGLIQKFLEGASPEEMRARLQTLRHIGFPIPPDEQLGLILRPPQ